MPYSFRAGPGWSCSKAAYKHANCPKHAQFYDKINLRNQCSQLVLLQKGIVTMHGHMNVKKSHINKIYFIDVHLLVSSSSSSSFVLQPSMGFRLLQQIMPGPSAQHHFCPDFHTHYSIILQDFILPSIPWSSSSSLSHWTAFKKFPLPFCTPPSYANGSTIAIYKLL